MKTLTMIFTSIPLLFSLLPILVLTQTNQSSPSKPLVFTHVTVIDATGAPPKPDMTVVITGDRITNLGKTGKIRVPKGAQVVDGTGKFLIPGLWDMHVHLSITTEPTLPAFIANGVTGVRDMGGDLGQIDGWRKSIAAGLLIGPRIVRAGPLVDGRKKTAMYRLTVNNPAEGGWGSRIKRASSWSSEQSTAFLFVKSS